MKIIPRLCVIILLGCFTMAFSSHAKQEAEVVSTCPLSDQDIIDYMGSQGKTIVSFEDIPFSTDRKAKDDTGIWYRILTDSHDCSIVGYEEVE